MDPAQPGSRSTRIAAETSSLGLPANFCFTLDLFLLVWQVVGLEFNPSNRHTRAHSGAAETVLPEPIRPRLTSVVRAYFS